MVGLTDGQVAQYRKQGWVGPIDVLTAAEAADALGELEAAEVDFPDDLHAENRNNAHLVLPFLAELAVHEVVVDCVRSLVADPVALSSSVLFIKEPQTGSHVTWHQDATYMGLEPDDFVTAWIALTPSTVENGCVSVIPGTHRLGIVKHTDAYGADNILTRGQYVDVDDSSAVDLVLAPGQMSLHHPHLVHGSQPNRSDDRRVGVAFQSYLGAGVRPTRGEHHVMALDERTVDPAFHVVRVPTGRCTLEDRATRRTVNEAFADVLYESAEVRRRL
jgi:ectoine hydroxylase-related dioxygenase (phytanoyl-CoA dioxygenase family)